MSLSTFTIVHTVISLIGIVTGIWVLIGMLGNKRLRCWTAVFLLFTVLTSVTGFFFPFTALLPSHITGIISLAVLAICLFAIYGRKLTGAWRWIYVATAVFALYLNCFVLVVQAFQKLAFLRPLAPTQSEPPFLIAQAIVLVIFLVAGVVAARRFHPEPVAI